MGSIIYVQWTPDTSGGEHPPYRGKVLAFFLFFFTWDASLDKKAKIEYFDYKPLYTNDNTMQDLDDTIQRTRLNYQNNRNRTVLACMLGTGDVL